MPNYKGHLVGGACVYVVGLYLLSITCVAIISLPLAVEWLCFTSAGALFPDIDVKSKGQKYFYWLIFGLALFLLIERRIKLAIAISIISLIPMLVRHRGLFHRAWFVIVLTVAVSLLLILKFPDCKTIIFFDALFFVLGVLSHLWLDLGLRGLFSR